jgi:hypothetical protein
VGTQFSEAQKDSLARSYLLDALDASVEIVNVAIDKLRDVRMTEHVHKHVVANTVSWVNAIEHHFFTMGSDKQALLIAPECTECVCVGTC